jgi:hypothetical protein
MERYRPVMGTIDTMRSRVNFSNLYQRMQGPEADGNLLGVTYDSLVTSWENGYAAIATAEDNPHEPLAYVRFIPLLDQSIAQNVGLDFPYAVWETGTAFIAPELRGYGLYKNLRLELYKQHWNKIKSETLIIGTTGNPKVTYSLHDLRETTGLPFQVVSHNLLPHIKQLTCVCNPDFGEGVQYGQDACPRRLQVDDVGQYFGEDFMPLNMSQKHPCSMYVSSGRLALDIERTLYNQLSQERFAAYGQFEPPQIRLHNMLQARFGYYS